MCVLKVSESDDGDKQQRRRRQQQQQPSHGGRPAYASYGRLPPLGDGLSILLSQHPIPAIPPYVVRTPHIHGDTDYGAPNCSRGLMMMIWDHSHNHNHNHNHSHSHEAWSLRIDGDWQVIDERWCMIGVRWWVIHDRCSMMNDTWEMIHGKLWWSGLASADLRHG